MLNSDIGIIRVHLFNKQRRRADIISGSRRINLRGARLQKRGLLGKLNGAIDIVVVRCSVVVGFRRQIWKIHEGGEALVIVPLRGEYPGEIG